MAEQLTVKSLEPSPSGPPELVGVTAWTAIASPDEFYLAWGLRNGSLVLAQFNGPRADIAVRRKFRDQKIVGVPYKLKHFVHNRFLWLVVAYQTVHDPHDPFKIAVYQINGTVFKRRQEIVHDMHKGRMDMDILQSRGHTYMAMSVGSEVSARSDGGDGEITRVVGVVVRVARNAIRRDRNEESGRSPVGELVENCRRHLHRDRSRQER